MAFKDLLKNDGKYKSLSRAGEIRGTRSLRRCNTPVAATGLPKAAMHLTHGSRGLRDD